MNQDNVSGRIPSRKRATAGGHQATASSAYETPDGTTIDFHSAEFNRMDDLSDCSGNYRTFEPLNGVVTADMRHQMERRSGRDAVDAAVDDAIPSKNIERETNAAAIPDVAPPLTVISRGRTLIVDTDAERSIACGKLLSDQGLTCTLLVTKKAAQDASFPRFDRLKLLEVNAVSITGAFGGFSAMVTAEVSPGEQAFVKNCAVCHPNGGNIINPAKTLAKKVLTANGIREPADIVGKMRNPGPAMTQFDKKTIPDGTARAIAEYIIKTFK